MALACRGDKLVKDFWMIGVVQDEEPSRMRIEPAYNCFDNFTLILLVAFGYIQ